MELTRQSDKIKRLSYLEKEKLQALYQHADRLIFPSFYEGFGLPVVEAMKVGIPVLCSDIPPLREIAAGYADLVPPEETSFTKALLEENFKKDRKNAPERKTAAERFSWDKNAEETLNTYFEIAL